MRRAICRVLCRIPSCPAGAALLAVAGAVAVFAVVVTMTAPASAQYDSRFRFFPFFDTRPRPQAPQQWQQWHLWQPWHPQRREREREREQPVDFSKAPPPRKQDASPTLNVVVMGDSMADWLAYGLEEAFAETPEIGVVRRHRAYRGLIRGEARSEAYDWVQAAREILAAEKADFVVMIVGLADRQSIREQRAARSPAQPRQAGQQSGSHAQPPGQPPSPPGGQGPRQPGDAEAPVEEQPALVAPETATSGGATHEFRSEKWAELYGKRIDETIVALKSKGVPVFWVGLPPIRGARSTADMVYLNDLYRSHAEKAGITYVDVWDGFVDESGNFAAHGPDFEGQIRRLRTGDGVHFTKAGARKLAHYLEREIRRVMQAKSAPVALPVPQEKEPPQAPGTRPGVPVTRPAAGPVVPLTGQPTTSEGLLGASPPHAGNDPIVSRTLAKGEPVAAPRGRADDFAWPRQDAMPPPASGATEPTMEAPVTPVAPETPSAPKPPAAAPAQKPPPQPSATKRTQLRPAPPGFTRDDSHRPAGSRDDMPRPPGAIPNSSAFWPFGPSQAR